MTTSLAPARPTAADAAPGLPRVPPAAIALGGIAVLLVLAGNSDALPFPLFGADMLLAVAGFQVTARLLGGRGPGRFLREQFLLRMPLLVATLAATVAAGFALDPARTALHTATDAAAGALGLDNWWRLAIATPTTGARLDALGAGMGVDLGGDPYAEYAGRIDPLGALWLVGLLVQLCVLWPLVLTGLRRLARGRVRVPYLVLTLAATAAAVAALRALGGAGPAEPALGTHVRAVEFLAGATVAAFAAGRADRPARPPLAWLATHLGRGLPLELGRLAPALLVLHLPVFWLVQHAVPGARPVALLAVGGAVSWLLALVLQDGVVRRLAAARPLAVVVAVAVLTATTGGGLVVAIAAARPAGAGPTVLVLGGADAGQLATALAANGRFRVVDGSRPGCGLVAAPGCGDQERRWRDLITADDPAAIVVDLGVDAGLTRAGDGAAAAPCDAGFRSGYRPLVDRAVAAWGAGSPTRPVLVADGPVSTRQGRCLDALLAEAVSARGALVALPVQALLCPAGTCDGSALDATGRDAVGRLVANAVAVELGAERTAARAAAEAVGCPPRPQGEKVVATC